MALGVLRELRDHGLSVPDDVSVTGFDNINLSEFTHPPLTTVNVPRELTGRTIFEALAPDEGQPRVPREFVPHPELVIHDSTSAARR
jgi:DNA-binding LacI/PurR family transcriptional regulator